jgi:hypothetical protein
MCGGKDLNLRRARTGMRIMRASSLCSVAKGIDGSDSEAGAANRLTLPAKL